MDQAYAPPAPNPYQLDGRTKPPGIAMMVASGFFGVLGIVGGALYIGILGFAAISPSKPPTSASQDDTVGIVVMLSLLVIGIGLWLVVYGLIMFGGWSLMHRQRYAFALTGVILTFLAGIPCSCIPVNTLVFVPIGIWSLIVLLDNQVRESFT